MKSLKQQIEDRGIKQRWIAKQMGISFEVLNRWLNNKVSMPLKREIELKELLK